MAHNSKLLVYQRVMEVHYPNNCLFIVERFQQHLTNNQSFFLAKIHRGMDYVYMNSAWLSQRRVNGLWVNGLFRGHLSIIYRGFNQQKYGDK